MRYTPQILGTGEAGATRVVRLMTIADDPMEPPKFRHKKVPKGNLSPLPQLIIMHESNLHF